MSKSYFDGRSSTAGFAVNSSDFAKMMDEEDPLKSFRDKFIIPDAPEGCERDKVLYFVGKFADIPVYVYRNEYI